MNATFDRSQARFDLQSESVVLVDPLALDGLAAELAEVGALTGPRLSARLAELGEGGLRIGLHKVRGVRPGLYEVGVESFRAAESDEDPGVFDVDSGAVIVIDRVALALVARSLTWERYDQILQAEAGDDSVLEGINAEVGRPAFAIVSADGDSAFSGDGAFQLLASEPRAV